MGDEEGGRPLDDVPYIRVDVWGTGLGHVNVYGFEISSHSTSSCLIVPDVPSDCFAIGRNVARARVPCADSEMRVSKIAFSSAYL